MCFLIYIYIYILLFFSGHLGNTRTSNSAGINCEAGLLCFSAI